MPQYQTKSNKKKRNIIHKTCSQIHRPIRWAEETANLFGGKRQQQSPIFLTSLFQRVLPKQGSSTPEWYLLIHDSRHHFIRCLNFISFSVLLVENQNMLSIGDGTWFCSNQTLRDELTVWLLHFWHTRQNIRCRQGLQRIEGIKEIQNWGKQRAKSKENVEINCRCYDYICRLFFYQATVQWMENLLCRIHFFLLI